VGSVWLEYPDIENDSFEVRWQMDRSDLFYGQNLILDIKTNPNYSPSSGSIDLGNNHKDWLYTKKLYRSDEELKKSVLNLIRNKMKE